MGQGWEAGPAAAVQSNCGSDRCGAVLRWNACLSEPNQTDVCWLRAETDSIPPTTDEYKAAMAVISAARDEHLSSIVPVCSQNYADQCGGNNISLAVCSDPNSRKKYPQWPACTITPSAWGAKSCV
jgi:hypothetical protein